jgi:hypothetical protein
MKKIKWFWHIVHYFSFLFENNISKLLVRGISLIINSKKVKTIYLKRGVQNPENVINNALQNRKYGTDTIFAARHMDFLLFCFILGIINICSFYFDSLLILEVNKYLLIIVGVISIVGLNHLMLFRNDMYLVYFNEFEKMTIHEKKKWGVISIFFVLMSWSFLILSFVLLMG